MVAKRDERLVQYFGQNISRFLRETVAKRRLCLERLAEELQLFFEGCGRVPWDKSALSRYLRLDEREVHAKGDYFEMHNELAFALCHLLNVSIEEAAGVHPLECSARGVADPEYVRKQMRGRRHPSMCCVWAKRISDHFKARGKAVRVLVAPTHEFSTDAERLAVLGQWGAQYLEAAVFHQNSRRVLIGLGKHVNAAVSCLLKRPPADRHVEWCPTMGNYEAWDFFSANEYCASLNDRFGGTFPQPLRTPGFVPYVEDDDYLRHILSDRTHRALFGSPYAATESLARPQRRGKASSADTSIAGCGIGRPGNPLWETPNRTREPHRLLKAECPVVGDLNGHYLCATPKGDPVLLSHDPWHPDQRNLEAWDANRRALGASPRVYQEIANRHRNGHLRQGGGVIVMANAAGRAPVVYVMLQLGLVNQLVLDAECGKALHDILRSPDSVLAAVPARADW